MDEILKMNGRIELRLGLVTSADLEFLVSTIFSFLDIPEKLGAKLLSTFKHPV